MTCIFVKIRWPRNVTSMEDRRNGEETCAKRPLGRLDVDGRILLKLIFKKLNGSMDRIDLSQDRDKQHAIVNVLMNLWVP